MPQLPREVVKERAARLRAKGETALHCFLDGLVGVEEDAVLESGGRARLGNFAGVKFDEALKDNASIIRVRITGRNGDMLAGRALG